MNEVAPRLRRRSVYELAIELGELFGQQFDALQPGRAEVDSQQYRERRGRIQELQIELKTLFPRPSCRTSVYYMPKEEPEFELKRLRTDQDKTRRDEVFGGLSPAERTEYYRKRKRINELESELTARAVTKESAQIKKAEQRRQWSEESETDNPQGEARQPYRSRERDSIC
jgi:hypothetical protein